MTLLILIPGCISYSEGIAESGTAKEQTTSQSTSDILEISEREQTISQSTSDSVDTIEIEQLIFQYTNRERIAYGKNPLEWDGKLAAVARAHSKDMAKNDFFSHINLNGDGPTERAEKAGYPIRKDLGWGHYLVGIGENIDELPTGNVVGHGYVSNTPDDIAKTCVESWMKSLAHRENILESDYTNIGVGVAYDGQNYISTQNFR